MNFFSEEQAAELRELMFESSEELLQSLNEAGLELEKNPADAESMRRVRRAVHTLKGDSAACGFQELSELAHELEDMLTPQLVESAPASLAEVVLTAADTFHAVLAAYRGKMQPPSGAALRAQLQRLVRFSRGAASRRAACVPLGLDRIRAAARFAKPCNRAIPSSTSPSRSIPQIRCARRPCR